VNAGVGVGVNAGVGARGGTTGTGGGVGARGGGGGGGVTARGSSIASGSGIASKSESNSGVGTRSGNDGAGGGAIDAAASGALARDADVANSGALTEITPPQTEQRARTPPSGTFAGSTLKIDRQSGHVTFTAPPPWTPHRPDQS
jgi:hypothetical protein